MACYEKDCHYVMTHDGDCFYEGLPMDKKENCPMYKAKTNADRIRAMTDEELAMWINDVTTNALSVLALGSNKQTKTVFYWLEWLKKEAGE